MNIIEKQSAEIWNQESGLEGIYKQIERAARVCYQSQNLIKDGSAKTIVERLINNGHTAMLEHGTVYLGMKNTEQNISEFYNKYRDNRFSDVYIDNDCITVVTNYRVIVENNWMKDLKYLCNPGIHHSKRITICLTTNLQVATEYLRHRLMSFAMESTRYCSYDKEKFGNEISFILPCWINVSTDKMTMIEWMNAMQDAENHYMRLRDRGWTAQECAQVLPKATKTTLVITGNKDMWDHLFDLRLYEKTGPAHPQAKELAEIIHELLK